MVVNPDDDEALKRIINYPARGIGETTLNKILRCAMDNQVSAWTVINNLDSYNPGINSGTARKLDGFRQIITRAIELDASGSNAEEVANLIISDTRLIANLVHDRTPESISKQENLTELLSGVREFVTTRTEEGSDQLRLGDFLGEVSLATDQDSDESGIEERVTLMTVHAAKGLEFNNVFIVGVEEDLFPSAMSGGTQSGIEEERRLLYVALTRARNFCMMSHASTRYRNGATAMCSPSRFLRDIDTRYLRFIGGTPAPVEKKSFDSYRDSYHSPAGQRSTSASTPSYRRETPPGNYKPLARTAAPRPQSATAPSGEGIHSASSLTEGMLIEHNRFGRGHIAEIDTSQPDARIKVEFDNTGSRVLLLKFARFKIIE